MRISVLIKVDNYARLLNYYSIVGDLFKISTRAASRHFNRVITALET